MAALVVVTVSPANGMGEKEGRIGIFPGGATPTMYPAEHAVLGGLRLRGRPGERRAGARRGDARGSSSTWTESPSRCSPTCTRTPASRCGRPNIAEFPAGLPVGWHDFAGRWYDGGRLILSSRAAIQFVER